MTIAWHSMDTAPKDGRWVLLCGGECLDDEGNTPGRTVVAQWTDCLNGRTGSQYGRWQFAWYDGGYYGVYGYPRYWAEMPDLPTIEVQA